jgi:hypothetical protein
MYVQYTALLNDASGGAEQRISEAATTYLLLMADTLLTNLFILFANV